MVLEITKETWEKCGIKKIKNYNEKEDIIELWQKMNDVKKKQGILILLMLHKVELKSIVIYVNHSRIIVL